VAADGHVRAGRVVTHETGNDDVPVCVLRAVMTARFPPTPGGRGAERVVRYPILFAPVEGDAPVTASGSSTSR
jgi:hypothetical protein